MWDRRQESDRFDEVLIRRERRRKEGCQISPHTLRITYRHWPKLWGRKTGCQANPLRRSPCFSLVSKRLHIPMPIQMLRSLSALLGFCKRVITQIFSALVLKDGGSPSPRDRVQSPPSIASIILFNYYIALSCILCIHQSLWCKFIITVPACYCRYC